MFVKMFSDDYFIDLKGRVREIREKEATQYRVISYELLQSRTPAKAAARPGASVVADVHAGTQAPGPSSAASPDTLAQLDGGGAAGVNHAPAGDAGRMPAPGKHVLIQTLLKNKL